MCVIDYSSTDDVAKVYYKLLGIFTYRKHIYSNVMDAISDTSKYAYLTREAGLQLAHEFYIKKGLV